MGKTGLCCFVSVALANVERPCQLRDIPNLSWYKFDTQATEFLDSLRGTCVEGGAGVIVMCMNSEPVVDAPCEDPVAIRNARKEKMEQEALLNLMHRQYDANKDGRISSTELENVLRFVRNDLSEGDLKKLVKQVAHGDDTIDKAELAAWISTREEKNDMREYFKLFAGDNKLSRQELKEMIMSLSFITQLSKYDTNFDGKLSIDEMSKKMSTDQHVLDRTWMDSKGKTCAAYVKMKVCADGAPATHLKRKQFKQFENEGHTALTACCQCGAACAKKDKNKDGFYSEEELQFAYMSKKNRQEWNEFLDNKFRNGQQSYDEFMANRLRV